MNERDIEKYTQDYLNSDFESVMVSYRRQKVLEVLNKYKPRKILEIGCGVQSIFDFYTDYDLFTVVEPSTLFCNTIRKSSNRSEKKTIIINDFVENRIEDLKVEKFDFVILSGLLHEVQNPTSFLKSIHALCSENSILHINVPNSESLHLLWGYKAGLIEHIGNLTPTALRLQQNTTFNLNSLEQFVKDCSFSVLEKGSYFIKPFNHKKMAACVEGKIIDEKLLDGLYTLSEYFPNNGAEIFVNCKVSL